MKKRYAFALTAGLAVGNLFSAASQAQTQPEINPVDVWKKDPFACVETRKGHAPLCPNTAGSYLNALHALAASQWAEASNFMEQVTQFDKTTPEIQELALRTSILSGRFDLAQDHIDALNATGSGNALAAIVTAADLAGRNDAAGALEVLKAARTENSIESRIVQVMLAAYPEYHVNKRPDVTDAVVFARALHDSVDFAGRMSSQYQVLASELALRVDPQNLKPLVYMYRQAYARQDYMAALHYLDRYPYGNDTPYVLAESAGVLLKMGEKPAALQTLYSAAAFFDKKKSEGKELTNADNEAIKSIKLNIEKLQKELAPPAAKPVLP